MAMHFVIMLPGKAYRIFAGFVSGTWTVHRVAIIPHAVAVLFQKLIELGLSNAVMKGLEGFQTSFPPVKALA
jgi:hypothetical protein